MDKSDIMAMWCCDYRLSVAVHSLLTPIAPIKRVIIYSIIHNI